MVKLLSLKTSIIHNSRYSCLQSSNSFNIIELWVLWFNSVESLDVGSLFTRSFKILDFNIWVSSSVKQCWYTYIHLLHSFKMVNLLSLKTSLIHNSRYTCMESSNSVDVIEFWVIIDSTLPTTLIHGSLLTPLIQNGQLVVIEDITHS